MSGRRYLAQFEALGMRRVTRPIGFKVGEDFHTNLKRIIELQYGFVYLFNAFPTDKYTFSGCVTKQSIPLCNPQ